MGMRLSKRREIRRQGGSARRGALSFARGVGLFKLAAGLVAVASVLFLIPGLRLLVPGLQNIGTTNTQAMPVKTPQEQEQVPAEAEKTTNEETQHKALDFSGNDELGLIGVFGNNGGLGLSAAAAQSTRQVSAIIDVGDNILSPQVSPEFFWDSAYKGPAVVNQGTELSPGLAGGILR